MRPLIEGLPQRKLAVKARSNQASVSNFFTGNRTLTPAVQARISAVIDAHQRGQRATESATTVGRRLLEELD
jgi:plasmid maintenance system antidote protein VapI